MCTTGEEMVSKTRISRSYVGNFWVVVVRTSIITVYREGSDGGIDTNDHIWG